MKRLALLALLAIGCDEGELGGMTEWRVQLGFDHPVCTGTMQLMSMDATQDMQLLKFDGTWECGYWYSGRATGDVRDSGMTFLDLETTPGAFRGVRGQYNADRREIIGEILITESVPFAAYLK